MLSVLSVYILYEQYTHRPHLRNHWLNGMMHYKYLTLRMPINPASEVLGGFRIDVYSGFMGRITCGSIFREEKRRCDADIFKIVKICDFRFKIKDL